MSKPNARGPTTLIPSGVRQTGDAGMPRYSALRRTTRLLASYMLPDRMRRNHRGGRGAARTASGAGSWPARRRDSRRAAAAYADDDGLFLNGQRSGLGILGTRAEIAD